MQICILKHRYQPRPDHRGSDVYSVTFDSQWKMPPPVDTTLEGHNESLRVIDNPPPIRELVESHEISREIISLQKIKRKINIQFLFFFKHTLFIIKIKKF